MATLAALWTVARQAPLSMGFGKDTGVGCRAGVPWPQDEAQGWGSPVRTMLGGLTWAREVCVQARREPRR